MASSIPLLTVSVVPDRERVSVLASGELDLCTVPALREQVTELLDSGWRDLTVDLRELDFMDSSGVHALMDAHRQIRDLGARLTVVVEPGPVAHVLRITGHDRLLPLA
jgi:anti-sigma B factor antagonist